VILRGYIYWSHLDKRRPAIVVSPDRRNAAAYDSILVPCSTRMRPGSWHVVLRKAEGGLPETCVAKCEGIVTVRHDLIESEPLGGQLSPSRMREIEIAIMRALGIEDVPLGA
jgi:mRNA-degrading endonuclease toxin of MazEF toxin-antitoxin module